MEPAPGLQTPQPICFQSPAYAPAAPVDAITLGMEMGAAHGLAILFVQNACNTGNAELMRDTSS